MNPVPMSRRRVLLALMLVVFGCSGFAPVPTPSALRSEDLGNGLEYLRQRESASLPSRVDGPTILDFRYFESDAPAEPLTSLLQSQGPLRIVIHGRNPPTALAEALSRRAPNVLTLAPSNATPEADFELAVEPAEDRTAYEAYDQGVPATVLTRTGTNKARRDEAALVRGTGHPEPQVPPAEETDPKAPIDRLLQRAEQLARGLQALNRAD